MLREVALPPAPAGTVLRKVNLIGYSGGVVKSYPCHPTTTNISLMLKPGYGVQVDDDGVITGVKLRDIPCAVAPIVVPPTPPTGPKQELPAAPGAKSLEQMTGAEKMAAGYRPTSKDGKIVWEK